VEVEVSNSGFVRCERCWNYFPADELNEEHVCARCQTVLNSLKK
jgi:rRNA maturation endonuclease Nob1